MRKKTLVKDISYFAKSLGHLDSLNIQLIKEIYNIGPRNLSMIARKLNVPKRTVHARFIKLRNEGLLSIHVLPKFHKLGMMNISVFLEVRPGFRTIISEILKSHDFLYRMYFTFGHKTDIFAHFTIPVERIKNFERYLNELRKGYAVSSLKMSFTGEYIAFLPNFDFFDEKNKIWKFDVKSYISDIQSGKFDRLHFTEPDSYKVSVDEIDVTILHWLQKNALTRFATIAKVKNVSRSLIKYHYDTHVEDKLICGYIVYTPRFIPHTSGLYLFEFEFEDLPGLEKFAFAIANTPFICLATKEIRRNKIYVELEIPIDDIETTIPSLVENLAKECGLTRQAVFMLRKSTYYWKPIPVSLFDEEKGWDYREEQYLEILHKKLA